MFIFLCLLFILCHFFLLGFFFFLSLIFFCCPPYGCGLYPLLFVLFLLSVGFVIFVFFFFFCFLSFFFIFHLTTPPPPPPPPTFFFLVFFEFSKPPPLFNPNLRTSNSSPSFSPCLILFLFFLPCFFFVNRLCWTHNPSSMSFLLPTFK